MNKTLIIRSFGSIGDMLMMTPALKEISRKKLIDLSVPTQFKELFKNLKFIGSVIDSNSNIDYCNYDEIIDMTDYEFNYEQVHQPLINKSKIEIFRDGLNISGEENNIQIILSKEEKEWAENFADKHCLRGGKIILLGIRSANPTRDWGLEKWKGLIKKLKKLNLDLVVVDKNLNWKEKGITFFNGHTIRELFALVSISDGILCQDSGILHIGGAFQKKTLGIFGPTDPKVRCIYKNSYWIDNGMGIPFRWYDRRDYEEYFKAISIEDVEKAFLEVISNG
jgi:ADP-heptose:LPS heptosyltransferase